MRSKGRPFQKGQVANPLGAKAHNPTTRLLRRMTQDDLTDIATIMLEGNLEALQEIKTGDHSLVKKMLASICAKILIDGDMDSFDKLLNRIIGKTKEQIETKGELKIILENFISNKKGIE